MRTALVRASLLCLVAAFAVSTGSGQRPSLSDEKQPDKKGPPNPTDPPATEPKGGFPKFKLPPTPFDYGDYTAFPDLKPPTVERKKVAGPNGVVDFVVEEKDVVPLPPLPKLADDAPPLRKVQSAQLRAGLAYLYRVKELEKVQGRTPDFLSHLAMATEAYRVAAELEDTPAKRVPWYEARVRTFKEMERFTKIRLDIGTAPPQQLDQICFERYRAEAELIKLNAEVEKAKK